MFDLSHTWAGDLAVDSTGDLALSEGAAVVSQRVYRRLLTNRGDYIWQLDYGGGLASFVGKSTVMSEIEAVIRNQLALEPTVAAFPAAGVFSTVTDAANGYVCTNITYSDAFSGTTSQLPLNVALQP